ncbi:acetyl-CoA C-acyltransferase [Actinobacteria bacterium YIM 96077]|uniref:Steroid 3-ketoacyl-CoA thiolase n=1 Tax=Phytoactinopolyspora halophila TaxID=1981511 RepID=A0A329QTM1_9ACTN|nr:acetyl-CoA C-acyltransferase [Phytoactinopolyspora halophila]AYY14918.1 acetyl-CoA C-acyltransferase [Actinobacteria bacterium YIM 96077]RAW15376.1 steroid 3-ketoacyl-CoA thiolase [Phytoactinopolyspora halophila]
MRSAVIVDVIRTASGKGKAGGALSGVHPTELLASVLRSLIARNDVDPAAIDDVLTGCVSQVGEQSFNIARNALLAAGLPESVPGTTIDRQCGSSQQAAHFAAQGVMAGAYDAVIASGVESMSRIPMFSNMQGQDPYAPLAARYPEGLVQQGISAELIAARWKMVRDELDAFAARSHQRAAKATEAGWFADEIVAVDGHAIDESVRPSTTVERLAELEPAFTDAAIAERFPEISWSITPGNSSPLTDGASAALIMSEERATQLGLRPRARFHAFAVTGSDPITMLTGIIPATHKILDRCGLDIHDIDAYEVNEAFAPVPLAWQHEFGTDPERLNPRGGAIALGHPLGASGTKLLTTLVNHLERTSGRYGLQTMCEGGGMANATIIERL